MQWIMLDLTGGSLAEAHSLSQACNPAEAYGSV
jgi:hypothetical protein